ncbi:hypothetical protein E3O55_00405 [Cryobacterium sp. MDB1-18-2]|uniref:hypothetical protein n=1 Tax=unclassified Cryobacterium TaxID=2649013 RepID=UPI00106C9759|nr:MULTISPECIES: hypothetical protein [unclassified Cryobacterium]TFC35936.1 hypothetical protein E3O55_00405 [Cryobacterium sp. MDB1-18-2]TFC41556.1 hypothetical protein E3O50_10850 [Cryobacterium sp. MDB1-18-1]
MTLVELLVAMSIFALFVALILGTTVTIAQSATRAQLVAESSNTTVTVFGAFDRQLRYADSINFPGTGPSGARYVEFRTPANSSASGATTCTQWRFVPSTARLESRTWTDLTGSPSASWVTKASNVVDDGGSAYPFALTPADGSSAMQQLVVTLHVGNATLNAGAAMTTSFVARNSSILSPSNADVNLNLVSDTPVCVAGVRP